MNTYIETEAEFLAANENGAFDWEVAGDLDLADLEYRLETYNDTLFAIKLAFEKKNNIELGLWARFAWEEIAEDYYNSNRLALEKKNDIWAGIAWEEIVADFLNSNK